MMDGCFWMAWVKKRGDGGQTRRKRCADVAATALPLERLRWQRWLWCCGRLCEGDCRLLWRRWWTEVVVVQHGRSWLWRGDGAGEGEGISNCNKKDCVELIPGVHG
jgi:hypothetical protein